MKQPIGSGKENQVWSSTPECRCAHIVSYIISLMSYGNTVYLYNNMYIKIPSLISQYVDLICAR